MDEKGGIHFTDDITQVPEKFRPSIDKIGLPEDRVENRKEVDPTAKKKEDPYRDRAGRSEDYWRARVDEWRKKLSSLQERVETLRIKYNELTEKFNESKSSTERATFRRDRDQIKTEMDQYKIQIEEAKTMLAKKIPEEAEIYKAKQEWLK